MLLQYRRILALIVFISLALAFIIGIPLYCPGFPTPAITIVESSCSPPGAGATIQCHVKTQIKNEGTRGNVIVTTRLVNTTFGLTEGKSSVIIYMNSGESRALDTMVSTATKRPCKLVVEAKRRGFTDFGS